VRDQVSHPCKTPGKIIVLYILIIVFLDGKLDTYITEHMYSQFWLMQNSTCVRPSGTQLLCKSGILCTYIHTYIHTCIHAYIHAHTYTTCMHARACVCIGLNVAKYQVENLDHILAAHDSSWSEVTKWSGLS
jgi:hypothetical protein